MSHVRLFALTVLALALFWGAPGLAWAGPSASGSFDSKKGASGSSSGYDWPEFVVGGNAISGLFPFQIGAVGYLPKGRFAFQYDRQIRKGHWLFLGTGIVFDRGGFDNFRMDSCGLEDAAGNNPPELCNKGGVVGFDIYAGYAHKFFLVERPWLVPIVRGAIGYSLFALPKVGGGDGNREQSRVRSQAFSVRPGGGLRLFFLQDLGIGFDLNIPIGFLLHRDIPLGGNRDTKGGFLLGFEILPLIIEYRF